MATKITRTVTKTVATALVVDPKTANTSFVDVTVVGALTDEKKLLKAVKKAIETENCTVVAIKDVNTFEELYGMDEETFMFYATKLPPRKKNA